MGCLTGLMVLDLSYNDLTIIPSPCGDWVGLESLNLANNNLGALPNTCGKWTSLESLHLQCNQLEKCPLEMGSWNLMEQVDFHGNKIHFIPKEMGHMVKLKSLQLSHNEVVEFPDTVSLMTNLEILNMEANKLEGFPDTIKHVTTLRELNLSCNPLLKVVPFSIGRCGELRSLNLCSCGLSALPVELSKLTSLQRLLLTHNNINMLPVEFVNIFPVLLEFDISNNPLKQMPEKWNDTWDNHRKTISTGTGYSSEEASVWIQKHSRLYDTLLQAYKENMESTSVTSEEQVRNVLAEESSIEEVREDGTVVVKTNKNGGAFGGRRAKAIFKKHAGGKPIYRLPFTLSAFSESVKLKLGVRWSDEALNACVLFYKQTRAQNGLRKYIFAKYYF